MVMIIEGQPLPEEGVSSSIHPTVEEDTSTAAAAMNDFLDPDTLSPMEVNKSNRPKLSQGYYRTGPTDSAVEFNYFYVLMSQPANTGVLGWDAVYPVVLLTNTPSVKRRCAVCKRTYGEYRRLYGLMYSFLKRNKLRDGDELNLGRMDFIPTPFVELRKRAIEAFVNELVADHRVFNVPLFHAFFYTNLSANALFANDLGIRTKEIVQISTELQDYEKDILPEMLDYRQIMNLARERDKLVADTVGYDVLNHSEEEEIWQDTLENAAATAEQLFDDPRPTSCAAFDEADLHSSSATSGRVIPIVHRSKEFAHDTEVARSFLNYGNEERVLRGPDGEIRVYDPKPAASSGSCPSDEHCHVHQQRRKASKKGMARTQTVAVMHNRPDARVMGGAGFSLPLFGRMAAMSSSTSTPTFDMGSEDSGTQELPPMEQQAWTAAGEEGDPLGAIEEEGQSGMFDTEE